jgi:hypothetical protein
MFFKDINDHQQVLYSKVPVPVNSNEIVIFKVNFKLKFEKFRVFVLFYKNLHTRLRSRIRAKKTLAPASAKSRCSTGSSSGSATLLL